MISNRLISRIESDAAAFDYWYIPKGMNVRQEGWDIIAGRLRLLDEYTDTPWTRETQRLYAAHLKRNGLVDPYSHRSNSKRYHDEGQREDDALARVQIPVWYMLGLAYINANGCPEITEVGRTFMDDPSSRRRLLNMQIHRYQFYTPGWYSRYAPIQTFPVLALYRLLGDTGWNLTRPELQLFGSRIRNFPDAYQLAPLVNEWRELTPDEREELLAKVKSFELAKYYKSKEKTTWGKVQRQQNYLDGVLSILDTMQVSKEGISVSDMETKRRIRQLIVQSENAIWIDYPTEHEWMALYGKLPSVVEQPWTHEPHQAQILQEQDAPERVLQIIEDARIPEHMATMFTILADMKRPLPLREVVNLSGSTLETAEKNLTRFRAMGIIETDRTGLWSMRSADRMPLRAVHYASRLRGASEKYLQRRFA